jgi:hypothetical protein
MYLKMPFDCHPTVVPFEAGDVQVRNVEGLVLPLQEMELAERFLDMPNMEKKGIVKAGKSRSCSENIYFILTL